MKRHRPLAEKYFELHSEQNTLWSSKKEFADDTNGSPLPTAKVGTRLLTIQLDICMGMG